MVLWGACLFAPTVSTWLRISRGMSRDEANTRVREALKNPRLRTMRKLAKSIGCSAATVRPHRLHGNPEVQAANLLMGSRCPGRGPTDGTAGYVPRPVSDRPVPNRGRVCGHGRGRHRFAVFAWYNACR